MSDRGVSDRIRSNVWVLILCFALLTGSAVAASGSGDGREATASAKSKKQIKNLKRKLADFEARLAALEGRPPAGGAPSGPAGGDLTGSYPGPEIGPDTVGSPEIVPDSVGTEELAGSAAFSSLETNFFASSFTTFFDETLFFGGYIDMTEISDPGNPQSNRVRIYARESANMTQLVARFSNGDIDLLAEDGAP